MRQMKDSGIEWIGEIPEGWEVRKVKKIFSIVNGSTPKSDYSDFWDGDIIWVTPAEMSDNIYIIDNSKRKLTTLGYTSCGTTLVPKNSILISSRAPIGQVALAGNELCTNQGCKALVSNDEISEKFFCYFFKIQSSALNSLGKGTTFLELSSSELGNFIVPYPPLEEQQRIADYLDAKCAHIDQCQELTRQSMEKLRAYKLSCITEAVTKGLNPDVPLKDSGVPWIGQIPAGWENKRLRYLGTCQNGISKAGEFFGHGKPFISYKDVYLNITLPQNTNSLIDSTESERNLYSVKEGDIFFTRTSETIEEIGFASTCINTIENACFAGFLIRFRPYRGILNKHFGKYYFRNSALRAYFSQMNIVTRASLSQEILKNLPVLLPPLPEQERIAAYLDKKCARIDALLEEKQALLDKLAEYKKSLIFECVTGKREVPSCWNR